jgi:hypothetical protein
MITLETTYKFTKSTHRFMTVDMAVEVAEKVVTSASVVSVEVKDNGEVVFAKNHEYKQDKCHK